MLFLPYKILLVTLSHNHLLYSTFSQIAASTTSTVSQDPVNMPEASSSGTAVTKSCPFTDLPPELLFPIFNHIHTDSPLDWYSLSISCKTLKFWSKEVVPASMFLDTQDQVSRFCKAAEKRNMRNYFAKIKQLKFTEAGIQHLHTLPTIIFPLDSLSEVHIITAVPEHHDVDLLEGFPGKLAVDFGITFIGSVLLGQASKDPENLHKIELVGNSWHEAVVSYQPPDASRLSTSPGNEGGTRDGGTYMQKHTIRYQQSKQRKDAHFQGVSDFTLYQSLEDHLSSHLCPSLTRYHMITAEVLNCPSRLSYKFIMPVQHMFSQHPDTSQLSDTIMADSFKLEAHYYRASSPSPLPEQ